GLRLYPNVLFLIGMPPQIRLKNFSFSTAFLNGFRAVFFAKCTAVKDTLAAVIYVGDTINQSLFVLSQNCMATLLFQLFHKLFKLHPFFSQQAFVNVILYPGFMRRTFYPVSCIFSLQNFYPRLVVPK